MAKASRDKGKRGERAVVNLTKAHGLQAERTAPLQAKHDDDALPWPDVLITEATDLWVEVKWDERKSVDAMVRQAEGDVAKRTAARGAEGARVPAVFWKRNGREWRADVPAAYLLTLLAELVELRPENARRHDQAARAKDALVVGDGQAALDALSDHERRPCARDSDWCDGVLCRQRWGIDCPNADPEPRP